MNIDETIHILENSKLVSDNFTPEAVTAAYVEALAALNSKKAEEKPKKKWAEQDVAGAKAVRLLWPKATTVYKPYDDIARAKDERISVGGSSGFWTGAEYRWSISENAFPSLKYGEKALIDDILGAEKKDTEICSLDVLAQPSQNHWRRCYEQQVYSKGHSRRKGRETTMAAGKAGEPIRR